MDKPSVGMNLRRGGAKLRSLARAHGCLHMLLWQAREAEAAILAAATAQRSLFTDVAAWASSENRALSDVCTNAAELSNVYTAAQVQLAMAYKSFRKDMSIVLEGERRCDQAQKKLQDAENKRLKLRRQVLRAQNRAQVDGENVRRSGDFTNLQTQLAEAERIAERAHMESCESSREQEAIKLVIVRAALSKLSQAHLSHSEHSKSIFEANREIANELPEPPAPGDQLSCVRYTGFEATRALVDRVKTQIQQSPSQLGPAFTSTPVNSPNSSVWTTPEPSAPADSLSLNEPPPPYNCNFLRASPDGMRVTRSHSNLNSSNPNHRRSYSNSTVSPLPAISQPNSNLNGNSVAEISGSPYNSPTRRY